jgi:hypothetical protein
LEDEEILSNVGAAVSKFEIALLRVKRAFCSSENIFQRWKAASEDQKRRALFVLQPFTQFLGFKWFLGQSKMNHPGCQGKNASKTHPEGHNFKLFFTDFCKCLSAFMLRSKIVGGGVK